LKVISEGSYLQKRNFHLHVTHDRRSQSFISGQDRQPCLQWIEWKKKMSPLGDIFLCRFPIFGIDVVNPP
jgi:hypothetical protein